MSNITFPMVHQLLLSNQKLNVDLHGCHIVILHAVKQLPCDTVYIYMVSSPRNRIIGIELQSKTEIFRGCIFFEGLLPHRIL